MSLFGMMRTSVSGMAAQAARLSSVADNIANSDTTGYKRSSTEFSELVRPGTRALNASSESSGGVVTQLRRNVTQAGALRYTSSSTDIAVNGSGFLVGADANGQPHLTRAGSFVPNADGELVNTAGLKLMGYDVTNGTPAPVANGFGGLVPISISQTDLIAEPTRLAVFSANVPASDTAVTGDTPADNSATTTFGHKTSLVAYDNLGGTQLLDIFHTKTGANTWEISVFDQASAGGGSGFPYATGPLATQTLTFDGTNGQLLSGSTMAVPIPSGQSATFDLTGMTQLAGDYTVFDATTDGNAPQQITSVDIDASGALNARYGNGTVRELYRIPLANVVSPDNLQGRTGSVFMESTESGQVQVGFPGEGNLGTIIAGALEQSNVDIAEELTSMIQSQRGYTANSKVFQTGSDLMDVLVNLKR
ncbi:MAG: flagellar hook protein FlgE [Pseudomonadota bacterium]